jgi:LCP family protein required for cell wall assembly
MQPLWGWRMLGVRFLIALAAVSVATASSFGYAYWFANEQLERASRVHISDKVLTPTKPAQPANYLIVGSDSRAFVNNQTAREHFGDTKTNPENLADVIMIAHVDPSSRGKGFLVSIPRDTWVAIPGHGNQKINAAFSGTNGPETLIETIEQNFHVAINHYIKLDFLAFTDVVNAIGRVHIFFPAQARDVETGLLVTNPGCVALDGLQALAYARSRTYQDRASSTQAWTSQPGLPDIERIKRQQYFMRSLAEEAIKKSARNPLTARAILQNVVHDLVVDQNMHLADFLSLARAFRSVNPGDVQMITVPTTSEVLTSGSHHTDIQRVVESQAAPIFQLLGSFTKATKAAPPVPRSHIKVQVLNGSGVKGVASTAEHALLTAGFANGGAPTDADNHAYYLTQVRYTAGHEAEARTVASYLGGVGVPTLSTAALGSADVVVVTGADFTAVAAPGHHTTATSPATTEFPNPGSSPGITTPKFTGSPVGCG